VVGTRWQKVLGDLRINRARTALVALSIAVGVLCVGMVAGTGTVVSRYLSDDYSAAKPPDATLSTDPFGPGLLEQVRRVPGVAQVAARYRLDARMKSSSGAWRDLTVFALPSFDHQSISMVARGHGTWPPPPRQLLLTRASQSYLGTSTGKQVLVALPDGSRRLLRVAGTTVDILQPSPFVSGMSYAYVTLPTLSWLGVSPAFNQLDLTIAGRHDWTRSRQVAATVRSLIEPSGRHVYSTLVPKPGDFWANSAIQTMLTLLLLLGAVCLLMSGFLVINTVGATMTRQVRQIGVMKAIGATPRQLAEMYPVMVLPPCLLALLIAIPLGAAGALELTGYATSLLDFDAVAGFPSPSVLLVEVIAGVAVPLLAALGPVMAGSRITVRQAITSYGVGGETRIGLGSWARSLDRLPRPLLLSLSNAFRRPVRLALTLLAMVLGGTVFIAVLSVRGSLVQTLDDVMAYRNYDVQLVFTHPSRLARLDAVVRPAPRVVAVEGWATATAQARLPGRGPSADIAIVGAPPQSTLIKPSVLEGRWLLPGDARAIVVNGDVLANEPDLSPGQEMRITIDGDASTWAVIGVVRGVQSGPIAYVPFSALTGVTDRAGMVDQLQVVGASHDSASETALAAGVEQRLQRAGFSISSTQTTADQRAVLAANYDLIVVFLLAMALLLGLVGGLGLMGTLGINVLERTREIGIMRAIGASNANVLQVIMLEGILIGLMSWVCALILAIPVSPVLAQAVGRSFLQAQLDYGFSWTGAAIWLAGVVAIAALAGFLPARSASRLTVRDVLDYE
jgi:putative ABC transport system permease protein